MMPPHYFQIICCPKCKSDLKVNSARKNELRCQKCNSLYPVVEDIPILLYETEDKVSQYIKQFYDSQWKRNEKGVLKARIKHEDMSDIGQLYIRRNENRFLSLFNRQQERESGLFLDAASGAQPRIEFGENFSRHVCLDFSLDGLLESRKLLGKRAICICGSLLNIPIKDSVCDGVIASHVIYHIDKNLQADAVRQLAQVLKPGGKMLILYANPHSPERLIYKGIKKILRRKDATTGENIYYYIHPVSYMLKVLSADFDQAKIEVKFLRMFTRGLTKFLFKNRLLGRLSYQTILAAESIFRHNPQAASYVCYIAEK